VKKDFRERKEKVVLLWSGVRRGCGCSCHIMGKRSGVKTKSTQRGSERERHRGFYSDCCLQRVKECHLKNGRYEMRLRNILGERKEGRGSGVWGP